MLDNVDRWTPRTRNGAAFLRVCTQHTAYTAFTAPAHISRYLLTPRERARVRTRRPNTLLPSATAR